MIFLVVSDIDIHQLNLKPIRNLQILVENPFKKCVFLHFLINKCIINSFFKAETTTLRKKKKISYITIVLCFHFSLVW
jgi:hypothetical protein